MEKDKGVGSLVVGLAVVALLVGACLFGTDIYVCSHIRSAYQRVEDAQKNLVGGKADKALEEIKEALLDLKKLQ